MNIIYCFLTTLSITTWAQVSQFSGLNSKLIETSKLEATSHQLKARNPPSSSSNYKVDIVKRLSFWQQKKVFNENQLIQKTSSPPEELIDYLAADNKAQGWPNRPKAHSLLPTQKLVVEQAIKALPVWLQQAAAQKLAGIFFVSDLGGTGFTDYIYDESGRKISTFLVFDKLIFKQKANEWAQWKESSAFAFGPYWRMQMTIENSATDNIGGAVLFILLHELGHVFSMGEDFHPPWDESANLGNRPERFEFSKLSWVMNKKLKSVPKVSESLPWYSDLHFYTQGKTKIDAKNLRKVYEDIDTKTDFVSLYATTNPADDFAEAFAIYVHTQVLKKPYKIELFRGKDLSYKFESCWGRPRCEVKSEFMKNYIAKLRESQSKADRESK